MSNSGTAGATGIAVAVTAPFARSTTAPGTCTATLAAATTCTINVVFSPTSAVATTGSATITANVAVTCTPDSHTGTGTSSAAGDAVTPTALTFASTRTVTNSANQALTLSNTTAAGITGITVVVTAPFNRNGGTCTATLAAGATCTINVRFSPTASGAASGTATITSSAAVSGSPVALTGTGISGVRPTPQPRLLVSFPAGTAYPANANGTVTLTNTAAAGSASVTITGVTVPAPSAGGNGSMTTRYFDIATNNCTGAAAVLAPGASCTVIVTFHAVAGTGTINTNNLTYTLTTPAWGRRRKHSGARPTDGSVPVR